MTITEIYFKLIDSNIPVKENVAFLYEYFDNLQCEQKFKEIDEFLEVIDYHELSTTYLICILRSNFTCRNELTFYNPFLYNVSQQLEYRQESQSLLKGLLKD